MCKLTVEELISTLETYDAEHCVSICIDGRSDRHCIEVWDSSNGCTIGTIYIPESELM